MNKNCAHSIEFVGGPLDGHFEPLSTEAGTLPDRLVCYISGNLFRCISGEPEAKESRVTSVAIYERLLHQKKWVYYFAESVAPECINIEQP